METNERPLRRNGPIPLYHQLADQLREQIERGELAVGERIPSAEELARHYQISRMTVRQAIGELEREGLLEARQGAGTFVAEPKIAYDVQGLTGFTEDMQERGLTTHAELLRLEIELPGERIARELAISTDDPVVHVARLRYCGNTPVALDESYLPHTLCPGLENENLQSHSLYALLEGRFHLTLQRATQWMESTIANTHEASLFGIPANTPMMLVRGVTHLDDDQPIEYFKVVYRGDRYKFRLDTIRPHR